MLVIIGILIVYSLVLHSNLRTLQLAKKKEQEIKKV